MDAIPVVLLAVLAFYLAAGLVIGLAFVTFGVERMRLTPATIVARILFLPAAVSLWPVVLIRWLKS